MVGGWFALRFSLFFRWPPGRASRGWGGGGGRSGDLRVAGAAALPKHAREPERERERRCVAAAAARLPTQPRRGPRKTAASSGARAGAQGRPQTPPSPRPAGSELAFCLFVGELEGVCESNPVRSKLRLRVGIRVLQNAHTASTLPRKCSN